jgi:quercetin dioxygenase-like cupin family protein
MTTTISTLLHGHHDLRAAAAGLPEVWRSRVFARVGGAKIKIERMDGTAYPDEVHDHDEVLFVLDGVMNLAVGGEVIAVRGGEVYVVPAGVHHGVAPGSDGTLLIVNQL